MSERRTRRDANPWLKARNILAVRLDNLGDVLMLSPALRAVKETSPHARITLLASPAGATIAGLLPEVDDVIVSRAVWQDVGNRIPFDPERERALIAELAARQFDAALIFTSFSQTPHAPGYVCYLAGIPLRAGDSKEFGGSVLSTELRGTPDGIHQVDRNLRLVEALGFPVRDRRMRVAIAADAREAANALLARHGIESGTAFALVHPGASAVARRYPPERMGEVATALLARGWPVVVTGTEREAALLATVAERAPEAVMLIGGTTLAEYAALIERAAVVIGNNSLPLHLADATGTPFVALYSGTDLVSEWEPRNVPSRILRRDTPCTPCRHFDCALGLQCLDIPPAEVIAATEELLGSSPPGPRPARSRGPLSPRGEGEPEAARRTDPLEWMPSAPAGHHATPMTPPHPRRERGPGGEESRSPAGYHATPMTPPHPRRERGPGGEESRSPAGHHATPMTPPHPRRERGPGGEDLHRIAVIRALQLGDLLAAVPALRALRAGYPRAEITLMGLPWARSFAARFSHYVDRFVEFPGWPGISEAEPADPARIEAFLAEARAYRYDLVLQMHGSGAASNAFALALGGRVTAGYYPAGALDAAQGLTNAAPYPDDRPEALRNLGVAALVGCASDDTSLEFPLMAADRAEARRLLARVRRAGRPLIGMHAGARPPARRWPPERFAALADSLAAKFGARIVLTGGPGEEAITAEVAARMRTRPLNLAGRTSLGGLAAVLAGLDLFIGNDTGPAHLAVAVDVPSVTIFGPADPVRWAPLDTERHPIVRHPVACSPCGYWECPIDHRCLRAITADDVFAVAAGMLRKGAVACGA